MATVWERANEVRQPRGGYIRTSQFRVDSFEDHKLLSLAENIHPTLMGLVVDYLTRFMLSGDLKEAFGVSLAGAKRAELLGIKNAIRISQNLADVIVDLNDESIIAATKLVSFDIWYRNVQVAFSAKGCAEIMPDTRTRENIRIMVERGLTFFDTIGNVIASEFTFEPPNGNIEDYKYMLANCKGNYGGYTPTVSSGDGDFLTEDTLWDFKVSKNPPTSKHTLQLLMYWIMGQHSGQDVYKNITKLGIFNPRLNKAYVVDMAQVSKICIREVEENVIVY